MGNLVSMAVVKDNSAEWSAKLRQRVSIELEASAQRIEQQAAETAPKRSGALAASGQVDQINPLSYSVSFGNGLPDGRAIFQELGTAHHAAQPYLYPAYMADLPVLMRRLAITTQGRVTVMPAGGVDVGGS